MTDHAVSTGRKTPIWFWIVAVLATVWNFGGVYDYVMTKTSEAYLAAFTPEQIAYFTGFPAWYTAIWAGAVFSAFFASLALLLRSKFAFALFAASLVLFVFNAIYIYGFTEALEIMGAGGSIFSFMIFLSLVGLTWLSRWAIKAEILR
jgi:uncharacterized membrane protein